MFIKETVVKMLVTRGIKAGFKYLKKYMSTQDFIITVDQVLDRVEDYFKEGSFKDQMIEEVTKEIREYFNIPDND